MKERLQKLLATANVGSRRAAEALIEQGRVRVNGKTASLGDKADPSIDVIEVDGQRLRFDEAHKIYVALYKPKNVLSTSEPHRSDKRRTVHDMVPFKEHLFIVGRLDADSEGLVVLTNDGDLANRLTHPRYRHTKTYRVTVHGLPSAETIARWEAGIHLGEGEKTAPCAVEIVRGSVNGSVLRVTLAEGKKRQIRRVAAALGHPVMRLIRTHIGQLSVQGLKPGEWRELTARDLAALRTPSLAIKRRIAGVRRVSRSDAPHGDALAEPKGSQRRRQPRTPENETHRGSETGKTKQRSSHKRGGVPSASMRKSPSAPRPPRRKRGTGEKA
ncbi:MAG: pseudouridine synthase [Aggregatilineales bacterium]